jgi:hypothetical protein
MTDLESYAYQWTFISERETNENESLYSNRAAGGHFGHCRINEHPDAGTADSKETGRNGQMPQQYQEPITELVYVHARE